MLLSLDFFRHIIFSNYSFSLHSITHKIIASNPYKPKEKTSNYMLINSNTKLSAGTFNVCFVFYAFVLLCVVLKLVRTLLCIINYFVEKVRCLKNRFYIKILKCVNEFCRVFLYSALFLCAFFF